MLYYTRVKRNITTGYNPGEKYMAVISRNGVLTEDQIIDRIVEASSLSEGDVLNCVRMLQVIISDSVMNGITCELDQLGNFTPFLSAKAMETAEEVDVTTIRRTKVNFYPNMRFKSKLKTSGYTYRDPLPKGFVDPNPVAPVVP